MKDGKIQSQIAQLLNRHKSTVSREIWRNTGLKGYRPKQACLLAEEHSLGSRNATPITASDWGKAVDCLLAQWSPVQITNQVGISHGHHLTPSTRIKRLAVACISSYAAKKTQEMLCQWP
jgi:IS30 family transposase